MLFIKKEFYKRTNNEIQVSLKSFNSEFFRGTCIYPQKLVSLSETDIKYRLNTLGAEFTGRWSWGEKRQEKRLVHNLSPCYSEYAQTSRSGTIWGLIRNSESQSFLQTYSIRTYMLTRSPGDSYTEKFEKCLFNPLFLYSERNGSFMEQTVRFP